MKDPMIFVILGIIALAAVFAGYLLNIYTVLTLSLALFLYLRSRSERLNEVSDENKNPGGILAYGLFAPFTVIMLVTSFIVNFPLIVSFANSFLRIILR